MTNKFHQLLQAWRREKENEELQKIPDHFIAEMDHYTIALNKSNLEGSSLKEKITKQESDQANKMLKSLTKLRLAKIVNAELERLPINATNLTPREKHLHANLRQLLSDYTYRDLEHQTEPIQVKQKPQSILTSEQREKNYVVLRFIKPLPAIMGIDLKAYGPFKAEDVASLPRENALNLIRRGLAKEVKIEP
jgi:DNA replication factor GINS